MVGIALLEEARAVGLDVQAKGDRLVLRGPRSAESLATYMLEHKREVLALLAQQQHAKWNTALHKRLDALRTEHDRLAARWNKGLDFLEDLRERKGQDCAEFEHWFSVWEKIDEQLRRLCDQIDLLELTAHIRQSSGVSNETEKRPAIPDSANPA